MDKIEELQQEIKRLHRKNRTLQKLIDELPTIMYSKDIEGRFIEVNLACAQYVLGKTGLPSDLIGKTDYDLYPAEEADKFCADEKDILESGKAIINHDEPRKMKDGTESWILSSKYPVRNSEGEIIGLVGISHDISNFKTAQSSAMMASRMEATATLAGGIAHKVNNLMAIVMCSTSMLRSKDDRNELENIENAAREAGDLAHHMLAFAHGGKWVSWSIDLNKTVREFLVFEKEKHRDRISMETSLAPDCSAIEGDPRQIDMVLMALLKNAIEAIDDKGIIRITTTNVDVALGEKRVVDGIKPGRYVRLTVEDDGQGMDEETVARVFEPFYTTKFQGRGLGLAAVHGILTNHGGYVTIESRKGIGTRFDVYFSTETTGKKGSAAVPKKTKVQVKSGTEGLLVVDDDYRVRLMFKKVLELLGYSVLEAADGKEAIDVLSRHRDSVKLVVLDLDMPVMNGMETYPILKEISPGVKVLICSGYGMEVMVHNMLLKGDGYLEKPVGSKKLSGEIRRLLDEK